MTTPQPHILVVDDHLDSLDLMAHFLARGPRTVSVATGYVEAVRVATAKPPDLLVTDMHFPDGDGGLLLLELREKVNPAIRGIAITGGETEANKHKFHREEFFAFLLKPVDLSEIMTAVESALAPFKTA